MVRRNTNVTKTWERLAFGGELWDGVQDRKSLFFNVLPTIRFVEATQEQHVLRRTLLPINARSLQPQVDHPTDRAFDHTAADRKFLTPRLTVIHVTRSRMFQQIIPFRSQDASLATAFLQRFHFPFEQSVLARKQPRRHPANPLRSLLFRPALRRLRHLVQISLHVVIIEQRAESSAFVADRLFDEANPLPQTIRPVGDEEHFRFRINRQHF